MHSGVFDDLVNARELILESYVNTGEGAILGVLKLAILLQERKMVELALVSVFLKLGWSHYVTFYNCKIG